MERIATDTFSFERMRTEGCVYVDKTDILLRLADGSLGTQFFVARPRRFGKSLTISTLQCLFEGRRDLFKGLAIEPRWDWTKTYTVLHLDMGSCQADTADELRAFLFQQLRSEADRLGIAFAECPLPSMSFTALIDAAAKASPTGRCVVLVDEYDKPVLAHLGKPSVGQIRDELKPFYGVIKYSEGKQRFALVTGVSKFSKVSIFSDLNNLNDLTMDARVATLFGYTHEEVKTCFPEALAELGGKLGLDAEGTFALLKDWYDGYQFHPGAPLVFNPVSVGKCLVLREVNPYWFETGTPTFLLNMLAKNPVKLDNVEIPITAFSVYEPEDINPYSLLYQTGYLTIKGDYWDGDEHIYRLGYPNLEVAKAFGESLAKQFSRLLDDDQTSLLGQMVKALRNDDVDDMLDALSCFFANIPANITVKREKYYQSLFYAVFVLIGARTHAECWTNRGRVDAVVETPVGIYVFEFKLAQDSGRRGAPTLPGDSGRRGAPTLPGDDGRARRPAAAPSLAEQALAQIKEKGYAEKYLRQGKKVTLVGAAFDSEMRNLADRRMEVVA